MDTMEDMLKKQNLGGSTNNFATAAAAASSPVSALGIRKNSQIIAKVKPKIRIIHIFAPEIIKTDAANFRELVQRLTGKPTENKKTISKKRPRNSTRVLPTKSIDQSPSSSSSRTSLSPATNNFTPHHQHPMMIHKPFATKMELRRSGFLTGAEFRERIKGEEEIWRNANSGGGFLGGFAELEGFMEQLNHEYPLLPATMPLEAAHHHMDAYGQSQLA